MNLSTLKFTDQSKGEVDGKKFKFMEQKSMFVCAGCLMREETWCGLFLCISPERKDNKSGVFKFTTL